jgi:tRNA-modifying protein YgfZ
MSAPSDPARASDQIEGYRSPLLQLPGAVATDRKPTQGPTQDPNLTDLGVAAHYGDPLREQRNLVDGAGFVDLSHRAVVRISGVDRLTWLNDLTTQRLNTLLPRVGSDALILSPQGHVEHHLQLVDDGEAVWVHVEPESAPALVDFLTSMRFMLRVEVDDLTAGWAVVWEPVREPHPTLVSRVDPQVDEAAGRQVFVPRADLAAFAASADRTGPPAGVLALEALRVAAGRPRFGLETDHRTIPHELGWIGSAVQLDKGCYRGQETVARVANLGRPPRRLVRLHLDGSAREQLPALGTDISADGEVIGRLTSAAYHYELGPIALAVIKYATPDDVPVLVGTGEVAVPATMDAVVERDSTPRPGQAARAAFRTLGVR